MDSPTKTIIGASLIVLVIVALMPVYTDSTDGDNNLMVLVVAGQSNAAYRNYDISVVNAEIPQPDTNVYYYGTSAGPIWYGYPTNPQYDTTLSSYGIYSMTDNNRWIVGGYEAVLAQAISKDSNCDVLIINVGISSATIQFLQPDDTGGEYTDRVISDALSKVNPKYTINKIGYMWVQGESNYNTAISNYISYFENINNWYHNNGFDICYMVQTRPANSQNAAIAQLEICNIDKSVILASTAPATFTVDNGLMVSDDLHYSQKGRDIIGHDIAEKLSLSYHTRDSGLSELIEIVPLILICGFILGLVGIVLYQRIE